MTRLTPTKALALCELLSPAFLLWLALTLPQPAVAQTTTPPTLVPIQQLTPTDAEIHPTPGSAARQVGFGAAIAIQHDTAMISMPDYLDNAGRVALFKRDASGQWLRDGSIDPASTPGVYGYAYAFGLGIALRDDYALILSTTANYLYRKVHDQWTLLDLAPGVCCFEPNGETLEPPFVFVTNKVYRIGPQGKLQQTQTLVGDDPTFADGFGNEVAVSDGTLVISATNDNEDRGALYTFEERHGVWVKTQKIVANDGAVGDELGTDVVISGDSMVAAAGGKDYDFVNSSCNDEPTSGVIYIFARVRGVWTQQQEIVNPCLYGFQVVALDHDWLAISSSGYAFDGQLAETLVYRRENLPRSSDVRFVPYGNISESGGAYESPPVVHGSQVFSEDGNQYTSPAGVVNVYDLPKGRP
jgi:hypothetical protein